MIQNIKNKSIKRIVFFSILFFIILFCNNVEANIECVNGETIKLYLGQKKQLAIVLKSQPADKVTWTSSNTNYVGVSRTGVIYAESKAAIGQTATITGRGSLTDSDGKVIASGTYTCNVQVIDSKLEETTLDGDGSRVLYPTNYPNGGPYKVVAFFRGLGGSYNTNNSLIEIAKSSGYGELMKEHNIIIIEPKRQGSAWNKNNVKKAHESIKRLKDQIKNETTVKDKIGIEGYSDGGTAVMIFESLYPDDADKIVTIATGSSKHTRDAKEALDDKKVEYEMRSFVNANETINFGPTISGTDSIENVFKEKCDTYEISNNTYNSHNANTTNDQGNFVWIGT